MTIINPAAFVAGVSPKHKKNPVSTAYFDARALLPDPELSLIHTTPKGERVYWIATKTSSLGGDASSPLVAALPGDKRHKGPGLYMCRSSVQSDLYVAVGWDGYTMFTKAGEPHQLRAMAEGKGLTVYELELTDSAAAPWATYLELNRVRERGLLQQAFAGGVVFLAFALLGVFGTTYMAAGSASLGAVDAAAIKQHYTTAAKQLEEGLQSPLDTQLAQLATVAGVVAGDKQGRVLLYQVANGKVSYRVQLAAYTPPLAYQAISPSPREVTEQGGFLMLTYTASESKKAGTK